MIACVYIVFALLTVTKFMDVISTLHRVGHASAETNPLAQKIMFSIGMPRAVWGIYIVALAIIVISAIAALKGGLIMQILFVVIGSVISAVQASVAHYNWTGRDSAISKYVRLMHNALHRNKQ